MGILDGFVEKLFDNLMVLMPYVVVRSYEEGVRWTFGLNPKPLKPGWHWKLYFIHHAETMSVVDTYITLPTQSVITKDEKLVCFRAVIGYRVEDIVAHYCNVDDFHEATKALAMSHLAKRVRNKQLSETISDLTTLENSCEGTLTTQFKKWGTKVISVGFIDFAEVPQQIRIFQDDNSAVVPIPAAS